MRLLWVFVVVGVAGGVAKEEEHTTFLPLAVNSTNTTEEQERTDQEKWEACRREGDEELCRKGFFFTVTALDEVGRDGVLEVLLSLEASLHPHVTFDVSLRIGEYEEMRQLEEKEWEKRILAREEVTLEVNDLRRVVLQVSDLTWTKAFFFVRAYPTGHNKSRWSKRAWKNMEKVTSDVDVFLQTDKSEYATGETVDYRAVVVDGNVDKTLKFAQVVLSKYNSSVNETRLPWVEVPESGILRGNFTFDGYYKMSARVTSNVTSSDTSAATTAILGPMQDFHPSKFMSVKLEVQRYVSLSQPLVKGRVSLTSTEGIPLEGNCSITFADEFRRAVGFTRVGLAGQAFELDLVAAWGAAWDAAGEEIELRVKANCSHATSGSDADATETILFYRSLFRVNLLSVESLPTGNSSHPQATVVLTFLVQRRDGGPVEEAEPKKGLQVSLLLSKENLDRLRPSATNFSLPIPPNGRVRLEFQVNDTTPSLWGDAVRMSMGDAEEEASLVGHPLNSSTTIHVTFIDPAQLIRRGDVVRFRVRSCVSYGSVNAILSSAKAIYSFQRFSFSPQGGQLDEVIELTIPRNATEGSLTLTVFGRSQNPYQRSQPREGSTASVQVNVIPSSGPQDIKIFDQVDVEMSTIVTFRLEGVLANSVISLQAAKLESLEGKPEEREEIERPLTCHVDGYLRERENPKINIRDDSQGSVDPRDLQASANFFLQKIYSNPPRSLIFIDVDTSTMDNGTLTVTKTFDRTTEFGMYVVSGATFNSKSGRNGFSNSPVLRIFPPTTTTWPLPSKAT